VLVEEGCSSVDEVVGGGGTNVLLLDEAILEDEDAIKVALEIKIALEMDVEVAEGAENVDTEDEEATWEVATAELT